MIRPRSLLALWGWLVVRTLLRRRWLQLLLLRSESGGWRVSPAFRATWADLVARMPLAGLRPLAPSVEEWDARCGELLALLRRCTVVVGRGAGAVQPPRFLVTRLPPTVPKHPMQNLWHAIEPKFLAEDVASVSQDWRRGAGSTQVSLAAVMAPCVWLTSPPAPLSLHARPLPERSSSMNSVCTTRPIKRRPSYGPGLWTAA